ncbi:hypothetical protein HispidOSU_014248 [Sigmodon hispidus]
MSPGTAEALLPAPTAQEASVTKTFSQKKAAADVHASSCLTSLLGVAKERGAEGLKAEGHCGETATLRPPLRPSPKLQASLVGSVAISFPSLFLLFPGEGREEV